MQPHHITDFHNEVIYLFLKILTSAYECIDYTRLLLSTKYFLKLGLYTILTCYILICLVCMVVYCLVYLVVVVLGLLLLCCCTVGVLFLLLLSMCLLLFMCVLL
jgi:hypothetical protein